MWSRSAAANLRVVRRELNRRRLRLADLPPIPRRLGWVALAAVIIMALAVMAYPLIETGSGPLPRTDANLEPGGMSYVGLAVVFGGATMSFALAAYSAPARWRRPVAGGLAIASLAVLPSDLGGTLGSGYEWPLATWALFTGLTAALLLVSATVIGLPRSRHTLAALAAVAPLSAIVIVLQLQGVRLPPESGFEPLAAPRLALDEAMSGVGALAPLVGILAAWAVVEYGKATGAGASGLLSLRPRWWWAIPALAAFKLAWIVAASAGIMPEQITPADRPLEVVGRESLVSLLLAAGFVAAIAAAAWRGWLDRSSAETATGVFWLMVIPFLVASIAPVVVLGALNTAFRMLLRLHVPPPAELAAWYAGLEALLATSTTWVREAHSTAIIAAPLIAALTALAVAVYQLRRHPERAAAAPFLIAFGAWTLVPSVGIASWTMGAPVWDQPPDANGIPSLFGNVHGMTLDLGVTVGVLVAGALALRRPSFPIAPPVLLALLAVSTVIAYGDQFTRPEWALVLFWIGLGFPVLVQYGLDAVELNRPASNRSARVLFALAATLLTLSATYAALLTGYLVAGDPGFGAFFRQLVLMPLALTFALAFASQHAARTTEPDAPPSASAAPTPA